MQNSDDNKHKNPVTITMYTPTEKQHTAFQNDVIIP